MLDKNPYTEMLGLVRRIGGQGAPPSAGAVIGKVVSDDPLKVSVATKSGALMLEADDLKINATLKGYGHSVSLEAGDELLMFPSLDGQTYYIACVLEGI